MDLPFMDIPQYLKFKPELQGVPERVSPTDNYLCLRCDKPINNKEPFIIVSFQSKTQKIKNGLVTLVKGDMYMFHELCLKHGDEMYVSDTVN